MTNKSSISFLVRNFSARCFLKRKTVAISWHELNSKQPNNHNKSGDHPTRQFVYSNERTPQIDNDGTFYWASTHLHTVNFVYWTQFMP